MGDAPPPLHAGLLEEGALAVALDYDAAWTPEAMAECDRFYCDDTAQVLATKAAGARLAGIPGEIAGDLGELAAGLVPGRSDPRERLFCMNLGLAIEDVATARLALDARARARRGEEAPPVEGVRSGAPPTLMARSADATGAWPAFGALAIRAREPEASREHHVAVRRGEHQGQVALAEQPATRSGDDQRGTTRRRRRTPSASTAP